MTATASLVAPPITYADLISAETQGRLIGRIVKDHEVSEQEAQDILDAALGFLKLCADHPGVGFVPSEEVDIGWHTFLLYTRSYAEFCEQVAGYFIHHEPNDLPGAVVEVEPEIADSLGTVAFMQEHDIAFNPAMWGVVGANDCGPRCRQQCRPCRTGVTEGEMAGVSHCSQRPGGNCENR